MMSNAHKRVVISGGASGLGLAFANAFIARGDHVQILDLDQNAGEALEADWLKNGHNAKFTHCDVTNPDEVQKASAWAQENWGAVDVLINNAGVAVAGDFQSSSVENWRKAIDINLLGCVNGCQAYIPLLSQGTGAQILNVSSFSGLISMPKMSVYNATKTAVVALSETLELELADIPIKVQVACPSFFRSGLSKNMLKSDDKNQEAIDRFVGKARKSADDIAKDIISQMDGKNFHILTHSQSRKVWHYKRYLPHAWFQSMLRKQAKSLEDRLSRPSSKQ